MQHSIQTLEEHSGLLSAIRGTNCYRPVKSDRYPFNDHETMGSGEAFTSGVKTIHGALEDHEAIIPLQSETVVSRENTVDANPMKGEVHDFCDQVQAQISTLLGRIESLKRNIGTTCHLLRQRLCELRTTNEIRKPAVAQARLNIEQWLRMQDPDIRVQDDARGVGHESKLSAERAEIAERCAALAIVLAEASIDDAERMILEAVAARSDAASVRVGRNKDV